MSGMAARSSFSMEPAASVARPRGSTSARTPIRERASPSGSTVQVAAIRKKPDVASIEIDRGGSDAVIRPTASTPIPPGPASASRMPPSAVGSARTTPGSQAG